MKREQIESIMNMASANGDILLYQRMREKLIILEGKENVNGK